MRRIPACLAFLAFLTIAPVLTAQHLYVGHNGVPGGIRQFNLPISGSSSSNFTIPMDSVISVDVDANGDIAAGDLAGNIRIYTPPLSGSSTPSATFSIGGGTGAYQLTFTPGGDLFVASTGQVHRFNHPFSNFSVPAQTIIEPSFGALGVALDAAQNLYVTNAGSTSSVLVYAPPYTGIPVSSAIVNGLYRKLAVSGSQLFVATAGPGTGRVDVYALPIAPNASPAFSITAGTNLPEAVALDSFGNLYVGNLGSSTVAEYGLPFSASSSPSTTLTVSSTSIFGIAVERPGLGVLPAVGSATGAFNSFFRTAVQLNNSSSSPMSGRIVFHRASTPGADSDPSLSYSLNAGETQNISDLLQAMGQTGIGSADVLPASGGFPTVVTRVFNDGGSKGTAGFTEDLLKQEVALAAGDQFTLIIPSDLTRFRYNVGVRTLAAGASISVTQRGSSGATVRTVTKTYAPHYFEQTDIVSFLGAAPSANDGLVVSVTAGNLFVYGATTDNTTQDPSVQIGRK
ncbi:MAG TPA: hypothetical protein VF219_03090 [Vicinamibacterales bacterium]